MVYLHPHVSAEHFSKARNALILEGEMLLHVSVLVISPDHEYLLRRQDFLCEQVRNTLDAKLAAIHIVAQKQKFCWRQNDARAPEKFFKAGKVFVVAVQVAHDVARGRNF